MSEQPPPLPVPARHVAPREPLTLPPRREPGTGATPPTGATPAASAPSTGPPAQREAHGPASPTRSRVRRTAARVGRDSAYLIVDFPLSVLAFCVAVTTVAGAAALITAPLFLPVGGIILRALAHSERALQERFLDSRVPRPVYASDHPSTGTVAGDLWRRVVDPQTWLEIVWGVVGFVVATITFVLTVTFGSVALAGLTSPLWFWLVHDLRGYTGLPELLGVGPAFVLGSVIHLVAGVLGLALLVATTRLGAVVQGGLAGALIGSRATEVRYAEIRHAHTAGQEAERTSLRRLERDLHDGPQQGLVRLQMDLARAERLLDTDPDRAREILAGAGLTASSTLGELRALSRGIAPPLLVDRGLHAALLSLAGGHPATVTIHDQIGTRLPEQAETALYFAASEALANVAKHARATEVEVVLGRTQGWAEVRVTDDGVGGASIAKGQGLAGLRRRLEGVQGVLQVHSPEGGPTTLLAAVPLPGGR